MLKNELVSVVKGMARRRRNWLLEQMLQQPETGSVFAYTHVANRAERQALEKAGLEQVGRLPHPYYRVGLVPQESVLYVRNARQGRR